MSAVNFIWTSEKLELLNKTANLPVRQACQIIGCSLGTLAGKRKRIKDSYIKIDRDDWDYKVRETWEQRKARRKREAIK